MILDKKDCREIVERISEEQEFDPGQAERMVWILDTLDEIYKVTPKNFDVFLKGGTCVQNYLSPDVERFSKDIDLALAARKDFDEVKSYVKKLNSHLKEKGYKNYCGILESRPSKPQGDVICFDRFFEAEYAEARYFGLHNRKGAWVTVEFHVEEITPSFEESKLSLLPAQYGGLNIQFNCATRGKLISDKIIAAMDPYYDSREEAKDVLDLNAMFNDNKFKQYISEAKSLTKKYASETKSKHKRIVKRSIRTIEELGDGMTDERLATHVNAILPKNSRFGGLDAWVDFCDKTVNSLKTHFL